MSIEAATWFVQTAQRIKDKEYLFRDFRDDWWSEFWRLFYQVKLPKGRSVQ